MNKVSRFLVLLIMAVSYPMVVITQEQAPAAQESAIDQDNAPEDQASALDEASTDRPADVPDEQQQPEPQQEQQMQQPEQALAEQQEQSQAPEQEMQEQQESQPEQPQAPAEDINLGPDEVMGIDTVDLEDPQGNWLYKRVWWERAESKYEKIRAEVGKIMEMRTGFFASRADLDKNVLDPFYIKVGLSQGELQEILKNLIEKAETGIQNEKNEELLEKAQDDKRELEKLQADVKNVQREDEELENAVMMLVNQISKLRLVEQQAWQDFKSIARVLDDRKARELFYKVDNGWRNVQELSNYIQGSFSTSFAQLIERIKTLVTTIDGKVATLKEKGVELKARSSQPEQEPEEEEEEPKGFMTQYVIDPVKNFFSSIWAVMRWPYDAIMGKPAQDEDDSDEAEAATEVKTAPVPEQAPAAELPQVTSPEPAPAVSSMPTPPVLRADESRDDEDEYDNDDESDQSGQSQSDSDDDNFNDFDQDEQDSTPTDQLQDSLGDEE